MGDNLATVDLGSGAVAIAVATYKFHTCALFATMELKCWGSNAYGQLGSALGEIVTHDQGRNIFVYNGEMGDSLPPLDPRDWKLRQHVPRATSSFAASLSAVPAAIPAGQGAASSAALAASALSTTLTAAAAVAASAVTAAALRPPPSPPTPFDRDTCLGGELSAGPWHTCAILATSELKCWGNGYYGALGPGEPPTWALMSATLTARWATTCP